MRPLAVVLFALHTTALFAAGLEVSPPPRGAHITASFSAIASNGTGFLSTWRDLTGAVDGILLDGNGNRLTAEAFRILSYAHGIRQDYLAGFGSGYVLVWMDRGDIARITELDAAGRVLRTFTPEVPNGTYSVAYDGTTLLLYTVAGSDFRGYLIDNDGKRIRQTDANLNGVIGLDVSIGNGEFLVAASTTTGVSLARISPLRSHDTVHLIEATGSNYVVSAVAAVAGNQVLMAWSTGVNAFIPVTTKLATIDAGGQITKTTVLPYYGYPYVAPGKLLRSNDHYVLVMDVGKNDGSPSDYLNIAGLRVDATGQPLEAQTVPISTSQYKRHLEDVVRSGATFSLVTTENVGIGQRVIRASFRSDTAIRDIREDILSITRASQTDVDVATDRVDFLSVWKEATAESQAIKAQRFDRNGQRLGDTIELARSSTALGTPRVESGNGIYLVVWTDGGKLLGSRISWTGAQLNPGTFVIRQGNISGAPAMAFNGAAFLVVWTESSRIHAAGVATNGTIVNLPRPIAPEGQIQREPAVVWDGIQYLVVWTRDSSIRGILISGDLVPVSPVDSQILLNAFDAQLARGFSDVLLVARRSYDAALIGAYLELSGVPHVRSNVILDPAPTHGAAVLWGGNDYAVAYTTVSGAVRVARTSRDTVLRVRTEPAAVGGAPAVAVNHAGDLTVVVSEMRPEGNVPPTLRAVAYREHEIDTPSTRRRLVAR